MEQFWLRRDPTPDTIENEYKEEHYRRIAYANERFASGIPGWKTDRGRIYITFGPPDEIDSHPSGGTYERPMAEGGGETSTYPFEDWRYRYIDGIGNDVNIEFVDPTMTGEYRMTMDPSEKDALLYVPNAGLTLSEQMGLSDKTARFQRTDGTHTGIGWLHGGTTGQLLNEFNRLEQFAEAAASYRRSNSKISKLRSIPASLSTFCRCWCAWIMCSRHADNIGGWRISSASSSPTRICSSRPKTEGGIEQRSLIEPARPCDHHQRRRPITTFEKPLEGDDIDPAGVAAKSQRGRPEIALSAFDFACSRTLPPEYRRQRRDRCSGRPPE